MASVPTQSDSQICKKKRSKKQQQNRVKMITGYIIYASEIRKEIIKKNPDKDFGGISKIVGSEWKNLPQETKVTYEKRAQEQNSLQRMLFANEPLNKLADVAAARAAEAEVMQANNCNVVVPSTNGAINVKREPQEIEQQNHHHHQHQLHVETGHHHHHHQQQHQQQQQQQQEHDSTSVDLKTEDSIDIDSNNNNNQANDDFINQVPPPREQQHQQQQQHHLPPPPPHQQLYFQQHPQPPMTGSAAAANYTSYPPSTSYCQYCYTYQTF